jgi:FtsH-binding integral membrane protein
MDNTSAVATMAHPLLRQVAVGVHLFVAGWMLLNGVAHQIGVLWKAQAGTLKDGASVPSLLMVGAALVAVGVVFGLTLPALRRAVDPSAVPALLGVGFLGLVIAGIASVYGFTFLTGSITLAVLDGGLLLAHHLMNLSR